MSPASSSSPLLSNMYPNSANSPTEQNTKEPFMYHIPTFRSCPQGNGNQLRTNIACPIMPSETSTAIPSAGTELLPVRRSEARYSQRPGTPRAGFQSTSHGIGVSQSTTKISGFTPLIDHQPPMGADRPSRPTIPLVPPPRRGSYSSSPWILPGRSDLCEDDVSYSLADPSPVEFRQHLIRRMECRDPSRMKSLHSCL
jgi:hypothetical protein